MSSRSPGPVMRFVRRWGDQLPLERPDVIPAGEWDVAQAAIQCPTSTLAEIAASFGVTRQAISDQLTKLDRRLVRIGVPPRHAPCDPEWTNEDREAFWAQFARKHIAPPHRSTTGTTQQGRFHPEEDEFIVATIDRPEAEVAAALGRTRQRIDYRRHKLRQMGRVAPAQPKRRVFDEFVANWRDVLSLDARPSVLTDLQWDIVRLALDASAPRPSAIARQLGIPSWDVTLALRRADAALRAAGHQARGGQSNER